jgi:cell fate regulator YaaT (PSP1 superfamily)
MTEVIGVRFKDAGKVYYFDPEGNKVKKQQRVIVETARGLECGEVTMENKEIEDNAVVKPLKKVVRVATDDDLQRIIDNVQKEKDALTICNEKVLEHKLDMKLTEVEYTFDGSKILFYFTSDGRVDFRELVKDLAGVFRARIELRQIGVRDEAKMLGGLGICGQQFCCSRFLNEFQPVSIKMAKEQGLSLNPVKISGSCGRLMCCLKYEQDTYEALAKETPKYGTVVNTPEGTGMVLEGNIFTGKLKVRIDKSAETLPRVFNKENCTIISQSRNTENNDKNDKK